jgi:hypothetical protein
MALNKSSHPIQIHHSGSKPLLLNTKQFKLIRFNFFFEIVVLPTLYPRTFWAIALFSRFFQSFPVPIIGFQLFSDYRFDILMMHEKVSLK